MAKDSSLEMATQYGALKLDAVPIPSTDPEIPELPATTVFAPLLNKTLVITCEPESATRAYDVDTRLRAGLFCMLNPEAIVVTEKLGVGTDKISFRIVDDVATRAYVPSVDTRSPLTLENPALVPTPSTSTVLAPPARVVTSPVESTSLRTRRSEFSPTIAYELSGGSEMP